MILNQDYSSLLEQRECKGGCGLKFKVLPTSGQWYARGNCASYCKDRIDSDEAPPPKAKPLPCLTTVIEEKKPEEPVMKKEELMQTETLPVERKKDVKRTKSKTQQSAPVMLEKQEKSEKPRKPRQTKNVVDRIDGRLKKLWADCIQEAQRLLPRREELHVKMDLAWLCLTDVRLHAIEQRHDRIKKFASELGLSVDDVESWIKVRSMIWDKVRDYKSIEKYVFDDLLTAAEHIRSDMKNDDVQRVIEDKINGKYLALIRHYDESLQNIVHFYEKLSLEFLDDEQFYKTYDTIKSLAAHFKAHADRLRNRKLKAKKASEVN